MGEQRIFIFLKAFIGALFLTFRNLVNFNYSQRQGNDRCLLVCIHALGDNWGSLKHCCLLCVLHNSVGSALLVLTVIGIPEPRSVERVTVQFLRFFILLHIASSGTVGILANYIVAEKIFSFGPNTNSS